MSFIYCTNKECGWSQDDFWSPEGYNPTSYLSERISDLFRDDLDTPFEIEDWRVQYKSGDPMQFRTTTRREMLADDFRMFANRIEKQLYITREQYLEENPERKCPFCGSHLEED